MRVFVAGATGAIGRQLVPRLVAAGHEVHGMTRSESNQAMLHELGAVPAVADALDPRQVAEAVAAARPDVIVHELTVIGAVDTRHMDRAFAATNRLRTEGTDHLLAAGQAVGVRRFVAQSNIVVYGRTGAAVHTEEEAFDPSPAPTMREPGGHPPPRSRGPRCAVDGGGRAGSTARAPGSRLVGRLFAGEAGVVMMTELRGASNAKAKGELAWRPSHPSWRRGLVAA
jgi:NAD dependent epimerase/dehydratase family